MKAVLDARHKQRLNRILGSVEKNLSHALSDIGKFNRSHPKDIRGWRVLALIMARQNDAAGLQQASLKALRIDEACVVSRRHLGLGLALDGEYESASRELRTVCSITPTPFYLIEFGTYLHLSGNSGSACDQFNLAKKLSEDKNDLKYTCVSAFGAIRSVSMTPDNTDYLNLKNDLLLLYQKRKNYVSSVIINYFNVRDFYKWRNLKEKDDLALFFTKGRAGTGGGILDILDDFALFLNEFPKIF